MTYNRHVSTFQHQSTPQIRSAVAEYRAWLNQGAATHKDVLLKELVEQEERERITKQQREKELAAQIEQYGI